MNRAHVEIVDLHFAYPGGTFSLTVPDLAITAGEHVACIGASGSGKSTLINLICGIAVPDSGTIRVGGHVVTSLGDSERRAMRITEIGMVFQEFELLEYLSGRDNILLPYHVSRALVIDRAARDRADQNAATLGNASLLRRGPRRLSQGERQRLAIARALVTRPAMLVCDEPTGNLDPGNAGRMLDLLFDQVRERDATLLMVTHDHSVLDRFDRVVDMRDLVRVTA
jgi:ABC-type lipoprotein export system ATPase subunit